MGITNWSLTRKQLALGAVVLLLLTAGCLGLGGSDDAGSDELNESSTPDENGDASESEDGTDSGDRNATSAEEVVDFDDLDPVDGDLDADALVADVVDNLDSLDRYGFTQELERTETFDGEQEESAQTNSVVIDRAATKLQIQTDQPARLGFLADGVYYEQREAYEQQYGSEWVKESLGDEQQQFLDAFDTAQKLTVSLDNATASLEGQTTVDGEDVYVILADVDEEAYAEVAGIDSSGGEFNSVEIVLYVTQDSSQLLLAEEVTDYWVASLEGEIDIIDISSLSFEYEPDEITVPEEALDAVDVDETDGSE